MYKLLPKYLTWSLIALPLAAAILQFFVVNYIIIDNGLILLVLLAALLLKRDLAIAVLAGSIVLLFFWMKFSPANIDSTHFYITFTYSSLSLALAMLPGIFTRRFLFQFEQEKARMTSLFENASEGILLVNARGRIILANTAVAEMFGYGVAEMIGQKIEFLIPASYRETHVAERKNFIKRPGNRRMGSGRELHALRKNGRQFPVEVSLGTYKDNKETFVIAFVVDISQRKEYEHRIIRQSAELEKKVEQRTLVLKEALNRLEESQKELQESLEKQKELNELKGRFVSMASHEFRTPLSTVLSSAELISKYTATEDEQKRDRHIERIKNAVHHLNDILEDFLSLGKLEEGRVTAINNRFNLHQLIETVKGEMENNKKEGQRLFVSYKGPTDVVLDKKLVYNILVNLLSNAMKYSGPYKPIRIEAERNGHEVSLAVKDHGIGIPKEDQVHLFNSFYRGSNASTIQGTGLGLHIVKRYVDLLNGSIVLKSRQDQGTTVTVTFSVNNPQTTHHD